MAASADDPSVSRPLYAQVRQALLERIRSGVWKAGQLIPNEFEIAAELGVSQGTARKALDALAAEHLVVRRQGRGTFVVEHTPANVLFRFFNLYKDDGTQILPDSTATTVEVGKPSRSERSALTLASSDETVIRIARTRLRGSRSFIVETIVVPEALFPGLADRRPLPNTLYDLYQKEFGVLVSRADERLTAVAASEHEAAVLGVKIGTPLVRIERIAYGLDERAVELRISVCHLEKAHYFARLR